MRKHSLCTLLCIFTILLSISLAAGQSDFQTVPSSDSVVKNPSRATITLYCNITGPCKPCKQEHMQAEACRQTEHAEKLTCVTNSQSAHQVALRIHRRINTVWQPLHISRSCPAPANTAVASSSSSSSSTPLPTPAETPQAEAAAADAGITQHDSDTTIGEGSSANKPHPRQVYFEGSRARGVTGGLNVLYFELGMLFVLSGALPVVYIRKRRYVRL